MLKEQKQEFLLSKTTNNSSKQRMDDMLDFLDNNEQNSLEFDEVLVRRIVERVSVYDDHIRIKLKSGIEIEKQS